MKYWKVCLDNTAYDPGDLIAVMKGSSDINQANEEASEACNIAIEEISLWQSELTTVEEAQHFAILARVPFYSK